MYPHTPRDLCTLDPDTAHRARTEQWILHVNIGIGHLQSYMNEIHVIYTCTCTYMYMYNMTTCTCSIGKVCMCAHKKCYYSNRFLDHITQCNVHWVTSIFTSRPVCNIWLFAAKGVVVQSCILYIHVYTQAVRMTLCKSALLPDTHN